MIEYMFFVCFGAPEPFDGLIREPGESPKGEILTLLAANDGPMPLISICAPYGMGRLSATPVQRLQTQDYFIFHLKLVAESRGGFSVSGLDGNQG